MKKKIDSLILILLVSGIVLYLILTAILDLTNKKDLYNVQIKGAFQLMEVEHSMIGLIPTGKDYYYLGMEEGSQNVYIIKASKNWLEKNFDSDYIALEEKGLQITALNKGITDYKVSLELSSMISQIEDSNYLIESDHYLDTEYRIKAIVKIIAVLLLVCLTLAGFYFKKNKGNVSQVFVAGWIVVVIVWLVLMLNVMR